MINKLKTNKVNLVKKHKRLLQVKKGNKIMFEILISRCGKRFNSFKNGLGIVCDSKNINQCIEETFKRQSIMDSEFIKRLITI